MGRNIRRRNIIYMAIGLFDNFINEGNNLTDLNVSKLKNGTYILKVKQGTEQLTGKFIVQH